MDEAELREMATKYVNAKHTPTFKPSNGEQEMVVSIIGTLKAIMISKEEQAKVVGRGIALHSNAEAESILKDGEHIADAILALNNFIHAEYVWM